MIPSIQSLNDATTNEVILEPWNNYDYFFTDEYTILVLQCYSFSKQMTQYIPNAPTVSLTKKKILQ